MSNVIYYKDEFGNLCNPVELDYVYRISKESSEYYISRVTSAWDKAKTRVSKEDFSLLSEQVKNFKEWIVTRYKTWFEDQHIHSENPDPPAGFHLDDGAPELMVCARSYDW
jgi:hypothetical protein